MNKEEKNIFIGELQRHINSPNAEGKKPKHFKRTKLGLKLSPAGLMILTSMVALGMLLGFIWTSYKYSWG